MTTAERNQCIYEVRTKLGWPYSRIAATYGLSRQRAAQVVRQVESCATMHSMDTATPASPTVHFSRPVSATEAARLTGISRDIIIKWADRGLVKIISRSDRTKACTGHPVLLDPASLQERIRLYRPKRRS